ncbi:phosphatase PAP2 family protein [Streptomyces sp. TLI_171]|uniref:phosphatase PAP2 family protein n=1 Tax=Streptomyces sp. TLI_171 TaxID=1938859 RepID=UPI000C6BD0E1|nr:phosphatase PAP2 family protein [Streptomyces sp. TLI_171]RKE17227.1 undecaprenyl-diphosphatase [Streptomyces sp. TLI_171]
MSDRLTARPAALAALGCGVAFAVLAAVLAAHGWAPFGFERAAVSWCVAHRPPAARTVATAVTALGTGVFPYLLALAAGAWAARAARPLAPARTAAAIVLAPVAWLAAGQLVRQALVHGFGRPRPPVTDWAFTASGFAFPSGHAFTSALSAGLLALSVARTRPGRARAATAAALAFGGVIGLSRIYLGVHWPLDVVGGWLLAAAWLALGVRVLDRRQPPARARADT